MQQQDRSSGRLVAKATRGDTKGMSSAYDGGVGCAVSWFAVRMTYIRAFHLTSFNCKYLFKSNNYIAYSNKDMFINIYCP